MDDYERYKLAQESRIKMYKENMDEAYKRAYSSWEEDPDIKEAYKSLYIHWKNKVERLENEKY